MSCLFLVKRVRLECQLEVMSKQSDIDLIQTNMEPAAGGTLQKKKRPFWKACLYSDCESNHRHNSNNLFNFVTFPKPCFQYRNGYFKGPSRNHIDNCEVCLKCERWIALCKPKCGRCLDDVPARAFICSLHFVDASGPNNEYPEPIQCIENRKRRGELISLDVQEKQCKCDSETSLDMELSRRTVSVAVQTDRMCTILSTSETVICSIEGIVSTGEQRKHADTQTEAQTNTTRTKVSQTNLTMFPHMRRLHDYQRKYTRIKKQLKTSTPIKRMEESLQKDDNKCLFYTGLTFKQILILMQFLGEAVHNLNYWKCPSKKNGGQRKWTTKLTPLQQLLIVLLRIRRGFPVKDLGYRFCVSKGHISKLTTTWIQLLYSNFVKLKPHMFPSRIVIAETLPAIFKRLRNIRVLVDCTEFFCQSPSNFAQQGNLYSSYKSHTTFKVLIGCTPNGAISYVSDLYEGATSDREIFDKCGLKDLLEEGDLVLADRGFTVNDIVEAQGASLNIPPFLKGRARLTVEEELLTKKIAKERIYVEHVIGRLKTFRLLTQVLPLNMRGMLSQIVFVCACLVNFQSPIVLD